MLKKQIDSKQKAKIVTIAGVSINNVASDEAISTIVGWIENHTAPRYVVTPNVDHIMRLQHDNEFKEIYQNADLVVADGMPLIWVSKYFGSALCERVTGSDLFPKLCVIAAERKYKLFFLGGDPGVAEKAKEVLVKQNQGLIVVGCYCPPFGFEKDENENKKIVEIIKMAKPDLLFVGLGAPKQEKWIFKHYKSMHVPVTIGIGISFSFAAGIVKRAPVWMQNAGLEWLWRLIMEPRRLWKRYLIDDMKFFWLVLKHKLS